MPILGTEVLISPEGSNEYLLAQMGRRSEAEVQKGRGSEVLISPEGSNEYLLAQMGRGLGV